MRRKCKYTEKINLHITAITISVWQHKNKGTINILVTLNLEIIFRGIHYIVLNGGLRESKRERERERERDKYIVGWTDR
jgi:hypothetical protein